VSARDAGQAQAAMQAHLRQLMTYLETLARERPELFSP
jgi:DNA-binding GntR family transcriptional regulator